VGLWGDFGPIGAVLCRIVQMNFGEFPFRALW
jgi:hypothetical protein